MAAKPVFAAGLDAGSRRTRLVICVLEDNRLRIVGSAAVESQGWLKGRIADQRALTDTILTVLREAEAMAGAPVESVVVGMGGPTLRGANGRGVVELGQTREVEQRDVNRVLDRASHVQLLEDRMVLQVFPHDFVVDDHPGHCDPRKMLASRLEINVHLVTGSVQEHNSHSGRGQSGPPRRGRDGIRSSGRIVCFGVAGGASRGHRGHRYRRAIHRTGGLLWRRHAPGIYRPHLRRPFHPRPGAGAVHQL